MTYETTPSETALSNLIYIHFIKGSMKSWLIIISATLLLAAALLILFEESSELPVLERPLEALLIIAGTFGSWMFMQFWNVRRSLLEDIGPRWRIAMRLDDIGVHWLTKEGDETAKWEEFREAKAFGSRLFLMPKDGGHIVLYARAFSSHEEFHAYAAGVQGAINSPASA